MMDCSSSVNTCIYGYFQFILSISFAEYLCSQKIVIFLVMQYSIEGSQSSEMENTVIITF